MYGWGPPWWYGPSAGGGMPPHQEPSAREVVLRLKLKAYKKAQKEAEEKKKKEKEEKDKQFKWPQVSFMQAMSMTIFWGPIVGLGYLALIKELISLVSR